MHLSDNFHTEEQLKEKLDFIYAKSKEGKVFNGILEVAFHEVTIITAIHNIKANKGSKTPGVDKAKMDKYLQMDRNEIISLIQNAVTQYKPKPVKRVYITKSNGKQRPLGIPTILDRIIQECLRIILEPIFEAKFYPNSYGFRPYRATKHALKDINHLISTGGKQKPIYAIEGDIKGYFDNIDHDILLRKVWKMGMHDKRIIQILKAMLKAGYIENDFYNLTNLGTPQGGIISPLLANIYLNNFDWTVGRMYHQTHITTKKIGKDRERLRKQGTIPKYLIRYADDWILLTATEQEAKRLLKYLTKYFKHKLKLDLSEEKTVITNLTKEYAKFLGFRVVAEAPRIIKGKIDLVGKIIPDSEKVNKQIKEICSEVRKLKYMPKDETKAIQIEKINSMIVGVSEYWKVGICKEVFGKIDRNVNNSALATFRFLYKRNYLQHQVKMCELSNRPQRHKEYEAKGFAIKYNDMWIGITKAAITPSSWQAKPFNQNMTPYTELGRNLYITQNKKEKSPIVRPTLYNMEMITNSFKEPIYNFEYYMNREYAFNRDKGKCRICGKELFIQNMHCHHIENKLPWNLINKVGNLAWMHNKCHSYVHAKDLPDLDKKIINKLTKFRNKLTPTNRSSIDKAV